MLLHQVELRQAVLFTDDCKNYEYNEDFVEECADMIRMNPNAFGPKIARVQNAMGIDPQSSNAVPVGDEQWMYAKGCRCRKSKCLELVCECLKHEVRCTAKSRCIECGNGPRLKKSNSNIETDHCDARGLTYEESTMENTKQYEETLNRNKRPRNF